MIFTHAKILESCINELPPSEDETMMISLQALDDSLYDAQAEIMRLRVRLDALMGLLSVSDARVAELEAQVREIPDLLVIAHMQGAEQAKDQIQALRAQIESMDCRAAGRVGEISGSHCPTDKPCDRCVAERRIADLTAERDRYREALERIYLTLNQPGEPDRRFMADIQSIAREALEPTK